MGVLTLVTLALRLSSCPSLAMGTHVLVNGKPSISVECWL